MATVDTQFKKGVIPSLCANCNWIKRFENNEGANKTIK